MGRDKNIPVGLVELIGEEKGKERRREGGGMIKEEGISTLKEEGR